MKKIVCYTILTLIGSLIISCSYAQVIDFSDIHTVKKFKLNVGAIRFSKDSIYNGDSGKDAPNKYHGELTFGEYAFELKIFDIRNKWVFTSSKGFLFEDIGKGKYAEPTDGFLPSYDIKTRIEHYRCAKGGIDVSFQNEASHPDDWIEIHITVSINSEIGHTTGKYLVFAGTGSFLYNTKTHEIKQS